VHQANNLINRLENSGAGVLMHPDYGELNVGFDTFSTGVNTKRNMVITRLNFLEDNRFNFLSIDLRSLLFETIKQTSQQVVSSTLNSIIKSTDKFGTIIDFKNHIDSNISIDNIDSTLTSRLDAVPSSISSTNPITRTFNQQHHALFTASDFADKKYNSIDVFKNDAANINYTFNDPLITNSSSANDFYNLKSILARQLISNNTNLPKIKIHSANVQIPTEQLKHQLGDEVGDLNSPIHPLFNDNEVKYVK
jgi:hypothetical protein